MEIDSVYIQVERDVWDTSWGCFFYFSTLLSMYKILLNFEWNQNTESIGNMCRNVKKK